MVPLMHLWTISNLVTSVSVMQTTTISLPTYRGLVPRFTTTMAIFLGANYFRVSPLPRFLVGLRLLILMLPPLVVSWFDLLRGTELINLDSFSFIIGVIP